MFRLNHNVAPAAAPAAAFPTKPKPRRSLSGRVLSALSPGKKKYIYTHSTSHSWASLTGIY